MRKKCCALKGGKEGGKQKVPNRIGKLSLTECTRKMVSLVLREVREREADDGDVG